MDILPNENTLAEIRPIGDDLDERIERLKKRELLPAKVLLEMCETVSNVWKCNVVGERDYSQGK